MQNFPPNSKISLHISIFLGNELPKFPIFSHHGQKKKEKKKEMKLELKLKFYSSWLTCSLYSQNIPQGLPLGNVRKCSGGLPFFCYKPIRICK